MNNSGAIIRPWSEADNNFVYSSWLRSFKTSHYAGSLPDNLYWPAYQVALEQILTQPNTRCLVACNPEFPDQIFGYIVFDEPGEVVHYVYVKGPFRKLGIGSELLRFATNGRAEVSYTFRTPDVQHLSKKVRMVFRPKLVRRKSK